MANLTYDGSARDHEVIPQVLKLNRHTKKPIPRKVVKPAKTIFKKVSTYNLHGMLFPAGKKVSVTEKATIRKAFALGCFSIEILEKEPVWYDKKWLAEALQSERVKEIGGKDLKKAAKVPTAKLAGKKKTVDYSDDGYDHMKRIELTRLANARGLSIDASMKPDQIRALLRRGEAEARAEEEAESIELGEQQAGPVDDADEGDEIPDEDIDDFTDAG
jgi:hypothetical protein